MKLTILILLSLSLAGCYFPPPTPLDGLEVHDAAGNRYMLIGADNGRYRVRPIRTALSAEAP